MAELDVVVIGGGLAGIAASLELLHAGRRVLLLEEGPRLGGKAGSTRTAGGEFPTGPTSFNGRVPAFWGLVERLGLQDEVVKLHPRSSARFVVRGQRLHALKPNPFSVLATGALTVSEKFALARELVAPKPARQSDEDESLEALLVRRFGPSAVEHFFAAVFTGIFAGDLSKLSARSCMPALVAAEREYGSVLKGALRSMRQPIEGAQPGLFTFKRGFAVIDEHARARIPHRLQARVTQLEVTSDGVEVRLGSERLFARQAILATEAHVAAKLLPRAAPVLGGFAMAPMTLVQWSERKPGESKLPEGFGYLSAPAEGLFALGSLFVGDLVGEQPRRFSTYVGGALFPERASLPDEHLADGVAADLQVLTGGKLGEINNIVRWPRAVFQPPIGHQRDVQRLREALAGLPVTLAGSYLGGAAMKDALHSGVAAAKELLARAPVAAALEVAS